MHDEAVAWRHEHAREPRCSNTSSHRLASFAADRPRAFGRGSVTEGGGMRGVARLSSRAAAAERYTAAVPVRRQPRRAASIAATSIFFIFIIASKARLARRRRRPSPRSAHAA